MRVLRLHSLLIGLALAAAAPSQSQSSDVPTVTATVELPTDTPTDNDTKIKLNDLANTLQQLAADNYPLIIKVLQLEGKPPASDKVHILVTYSYKGVAETSRTKDGPRIKVSASFILGHPNDVGLIVHEMTHVVQNYPHNDAGWLVEGIADYVRWFFYEPANKRPHPRQAKAEAKGSYQTTAAFLYWAASRYDSNLVPKLNAALHDGAYSDDLFTQATGKSLDQLNLEWKSTLRQ